MRNLLASTAMVFNQENIDFYHKNNDFNSDLLFRSIFKTMGWTGHFSQQIGLRTPLEQREKLKLYLKEWNSRRALRLQ